MRQGVRGVEGTNPAFQQFQIREARENKSGHLIMSLRVLVMRTYSGLGELNAHN